MGKPIIQTERKEFRLSEHDVERLKKRAEEKGMNPSEYLRALIWSRPIDDPKIKELLNDLSFEVNKIGVNINQIAHAFNSGYFLQSDKKELFESQNKIEKMFKEVISYCRKSQER